MAEQVRKRYRVSYTVAEGTPSITMDLGVTDVEHLYNAIKGMTKKTVDELFEFEAHCVLPNGDVEVVKGNNPRPKVEGSMALVIPKDIPVPVIGTTEPINVNRPKEQYLPTIPYKVLLTSQEIRE